MKVFTGAKRRTAEDRDVISILQIYDVESGKTRVLREFDYLIEAPNWRKTKQELVVNSRGKLLKVALADGAVTSIESGFCDQCNNDHVLSPTDDCIGISHQVYEDGESRIYLVPIDGGDPVLVTPIAPSYLHGWSPDGSTLSYCAERNGQYDIYTIPVRGGKETQLTFTDGLNDGPEYAPDGQKIWFNSVRTGLMQIWRMNCDGSEQEQMTHNERNNWFAHLSPDGRQVAYISYRKGDVRPGDHPANKDVEIHLMNADGSDDRAVLSFFGGQGSLNVNSWSPDGKAFAFVSYRLRG